MSLRFIGEGMNALDEVRRKNDELIRRFESDQAYLTKRDGEHMESVELVLNRLRQSNREIEAAKNLIARYNTIG